jgi:hypothetical protein
MCIPLDRFQDRDIIRIGRNSRRELAQETGRAVLRVARRGSASVQPSIAVGHVRGFNQEVRPDFTLDSYTPLVLARRAIEVTVGNEGDIAGRTARPPAQGKRTDW